MIFKCLLILCLFNTTPELNDIKRLFQKGRYADVLKVTDKLETKKGELVGSSDSHYKTSPEYAHYKLASYIMVNGYSDTKQIIALYDKLYRLDNDKKFTSLDIYKRIYYDANRLSRELLQKSYKDSRRIVDALARWGDTTQTYQVVYSHKRSLPYYNTNFKSYDYSRVDNHALSINTDNRLDIATVSWMLTKDFEYEHEKIRAIYVWLISNVNYDYKYHHTSLNSTWNTKKTTCSGYTELFSVMLNECNIKSYTVVGTAYNGNPDDNRLHAWSAVNLNGVVFWIDATWGASGFDYYLKQPKEMTTHVTQ
jgi:hypothetical protein